MTGDKMPKGKTEDRLYGQIIVNFVNDKNITKASLNLFEGMQKAFKFSPEFINHAKNFFTVKGFISANNFNEQEKNLLKMLSADKDFISRLQKKFDFKKEYLDRYDYRKRTLTVRHAILNSEGFYVDVDEPPDDSYSSEPIEIHIDNIIENKTEYGIHDSFYDQETLKEVEALFRIGAKIDSFKDSIPEQEFSNIRRLSSNYLQISEGNKVMRKTQRKLKFLFEEILAGKNLYESPSIERFVKDYNDSSFLNNSKVYIEKSGELTEELNITEDQFTKIKEENEIVELLSWPGSYQSAIAYFLINYLKSDRNRKLIYKCDKCRKYFITLKIDNRNRFCPVCSKENKMTVEERKKYMQQYREKKKENKIAKQREEHIKRCLNAGMTKEEAEEGWENYRSFEIDKTHTR